MNLQKRHILMKSLFTSQFNYIPIVWMCHSRSLNKVNHTHKRVLRSLSRLPIKSFTLLVKDNSFTIHQRNLKLLAAEIFKIKTSVSSEIMNNIFYFSKNSAYKLGCGKCLSRSNIHFTHFGIEPTANITAKIWNKKPNEIKEASSLTVFKSKIKKIGSTRLPL